MSHSLGRLISLLYNFQDLEKVGVEKIKWVSIKYSRVREVKSSNIQHQVIYLPYLINDKSPLIMPAMLGVVTIDASGLAS